jgi:hypothetical protein
MLFSNARFTRQTFHHVAGAALLLLATTSTRSMAQGFARAESRYGVLAGASVASISDLDGDFAGELGTQVSSKSRVGAQAAFFARLPLKGALSLQPELHYIQKGGKLEVTSSELGSETGELGVRFGYLEVPVLLRLDLGSGGWRPFLTAGPTIALRTSCKVSLGVSNANFSTDCDSGDLDEESGSESEDPFTKTDVGASAGAGLAGSLMGRSVFVQLRYNQGLTSVANDAPSSIKPKNRGFSVIVGLGF